MLDLEDLGRGHDESDLSLGVVLIVEVQHGVPVLVVTNSGDRVQVSSNHHDVSDEDHPGVDTAGLEHIGLLK